MDSNDMLRELQHWEPLKICITWIQISFWLSRQWFVVMGPRTMVPLDH